MTGYFPCVVICNPVSLSSLKSTMHVLDFVLLIYRKIPIIIPGLIFFRNAFLVDLFLGEAYFQRVLSLEGILHFKMGWA